MLKRKLRVLGGFFKRVLSPFGKLKVSGSLKEYIRFLADFRAYKKLQSEGHIKLIDITPRLHEKGDQPFDPDYFYQGVWAFERIKNANNKLHVDVGGQVSWIGLLTTITQCAYVDLRPLNCHLPNFEFIKGDITELPFPDNSVESLSCLHVAEHIGLGRYGDQLDPHGTQQACNQLKRVLAVGGDLYFSLPIGKNFVTLFNSHRIHTPQQIVDYFSGLTLREFSIIDGQGIHPGNVEDSCEFYAACGLFHFVKDDIIPDNT